MIDVREGDVLKTRMLTWNLNPHWPRLCIGRGVEIEDDVHSATVRH